jgi:hypothetical protein
MSLILATLSRTSFPQSLSDPDCASARFLCGAFFSLKLCIDSEKKKKLILAFFSVVKGNSNLP